MGSEGSGAWIGTNQAPRMEVLGAGRLIKPWEFGSGFSGSRLRFGCRLGAF